MPPLPHPLYLHAVQDGAFVEQAVVTLLAQGQGVVEVQQGRLEQPARLVHMRPAAQRGDARRIQPEGALFAGFFFGGVF